MKFSKQTLLGTGVFLGGSLLLYSVIHQVQQTDSDPSATTAVESATHATPKAPTADPNPLTADIATEQKILAQKQKEREQRVNALDQQAEQYLTEQQRIEAAALARSRAENQLYAEKNAPVVTVPVVTPRPVETATTTQTTVITTENVAPKPQITSKPSVASESDEETETPTPSTTRPSSYQIKKGEGLIALSRRYNVPVSVLAKANNLSPNTNLHAGQVLTIPSESQVPRIQQAIEDEQDERETQRKNAEQAQVQAQQQAKLKAQQQAQALAKQKADEKARIQAEKQAKIEAQQALKRQQALEKAQKIQAEKDRKAEYLASQQKLREARKEVKETDAKGTFGVQVALAADEDKANEIAKKLRSAGYSVKTSQTTRGVRVVVGPEKGKIAALALKDKVNSDPRVNMGSAWVLYW